MKNIGIILAGGSGHRMHYPLPKQFMTFGGKTVLEHSLYAFQQHPGIDEIFVVTHADYIAETEKILQKGLYPKLSQILTGGAERYHSTLSALRACPPTECNLFIHDAARPLVSREIISNCIQAMEQHLACTAAIPSTDTILLSDSTNSYIQEIPARKFLFNVQTPQAFRKSILEEAYRSALTDPDFHSTDDCGVIQKYLPGIKIKIVAGSPGNLKITYPEDLSIAEKFLSERNH